MADNNKFREMFELDVSLHTEQLDTGNGFKPTYLSWSSAILLAQENYEEFDFRFIYNLDGTPVFYNETIDGFFVRTEVTIDNWKTHKGMSLPVLDNKFKPQGKDIREYTTKYGTKQIQPASSFDINYSQMRCLTKNISVVTGIGLKLFFKEGLQLSLQRDQTEKDIKEAIEKIMANPMVEDAKVKAWFENKKQIKLTKSNLQRQKPETLASIINILNKMENKRKENKEENNES